MSDMLSSSFYLDKKISLTYISIHLITYFVSLLKLTIMEKKENAKELSFWQKIKLKFSLKFKNAIPEDCKFGAIDAMSVKKVEKFRNLIAELDADDLHPLFEKRNADKLKILCGYGHCAKAIKKHLDETDNDDEIRAYLCLNDTEISVGWAEKYFIDRNADDFFKPYLESHDNWLPEDVVDLLIEHEQEALLLYYIGLFEEDDCHNINQELLFNSSMETAKYAFAEKFLDDSGCKETIRYILKYGDDALVEKLLNKRALSSDEEYKLLFEDVNPKFLDLAIEKKQCSQASEVFWSYILEKGTIEQILKCIDKFYLDAYDEHQLITSRNDEAILHYLKKVKTPLQTAVTENYLFKHGDEEVLDFYRKNIGLPYAEERALIKEGNVEKICAYLKQENCEINTMNSVLLVETCNDIEVFKILIDEYDFSSIVEVALIRRNILEVTKLYISELLKEKKALSEPAQVEFVKIGDPDLVKKYFITLDYDLCDDAKKALLFRGDFELLTAFCKEGSVDEDIMVEFVKAASYELLTSYFDNKIAFPPAAEVALIERNQLGLTRAYLTMMGSVSEDAEVALILSKDHRLIKEYLATSDGLHPAAEKELLHLNNDEVFCDYIEQTPLFDENEVELVETGNRAWLEAYTEKYDLGNDALLELAKIY